MTRFSDSMLRQNFTVNMFGSLLRKVVVDYQSSLLSEHAGCNRDWIL